MEFPKLSRSNNDGGGMFDNIKSRLGFSSAKEDDGRHYGNGYDNYDDGYADDGYDDGYLDDGYADDGYEDEYAEPGSHYEPYAPVTTRTSGRSSYSSSPRLVTIDDVKSNVNERSARPAGEDRRGGSSRVVIDNTAPAPSSPASASARKERSEGLDSLFTPTVPAGGVTSSTAAKSFSSASPRALKVIRPMSYNDVESVARLVRAGDVVILSLKVTPDGLFNRVLDFSFGVASALDAHVDNIGAKVFAITTGAALTDNEKSTLRSQGVL